MNFARIIVKLSLIFVVFSPLAACMSESERRVREQTPVGNKMPRSAKPMPPMPSNVDQKNLGWRLLDGRRETVADYKGKAVILDFWATYCPPCIEGIPHFNELKKRHEAEGLQVIGLNVGGDADRPKIAGFVEQLQISYKLGYPETSLTDFYFQGDTAIPQTLVFDRKGQLIEKFVGFDPQIKADLDAAVLRALKTD